MLEQFLPLMQTNGLILEIGCSKEPTTDNLRLDIVRQEGMNNFVQASGLFLPFRSQTFDWVYCFHTLEHLERPTFLLKEIRRVSKNGTIIRVPYRMFGHGCRGHLSSFTPSWFRKAFPKDFVRTELHLLLGHYAPIFIELEARIEWRRMIPNSSKKFFHNQSCPKNNLEALLNNV